ncbi:MAG: hypothetical protein KDB02_05320 [Acidimicrobiales bacterium]|nr:hypothetical protein [Acidimicrobiales bacterium]
MLIRAATWRGTTADRLALEGRPRNPAKPERFANFGLEASGDERLTDWMVLHLRLAVWPSPVGAVLDAVETAVLAEPRAGHRNRGAVGN